MRLKYVCSSVALLVATVAAAAAQPAPELKLPASPKGQAAAQVGGRWEKDAEGEARYTGGKWLVVDYGRPILRGRKDIFGSGADYGKTVYGNATIWRAGANDTTRLTTQVPLSIGGKTIQPGVYNVFVDLKPGAWTLVLNTQPVQEKYDPKDKVKLYGAYNYDASGDVLRAPMKVGSTPDSVEQFTIAFTNLTDSGVTLTMAWEKTTAAIDLTLAK